MVSAPNCAASFCPLSLKSVVKIQLNGETREFPDGSTIESLITFLTLEPARVAIEVNLSVVRRNQWSTTILHEADRVEIVHFVGGG